MYNSSHFNLYLKWCWLTAPDPELEFLSLWSFVCSSQVCMGFLWVLGFLQVPINRCFGELKLPLGRNVWCPVMDWCPIQGIFPPFAQYSQDRLWRGWGCGSHTNLTRIKWILRRNKSKEDMTCHSLCTVWPSEQQPENDSPCYSFMENLRSVSAYAERSNPPQNVTFAMACLRLYQFHHLTKS